MHSRAHAHTQLVALGEANGRLRDEAEAARAAARDLRRPPGPGRDDDGVVPCIGEERCVIEYRAM